MGREEVRGVSADIFSKVQTYLASEYLHFLEQIGLFSTPSSYIFKLLISLCLNVLLLSIFKKL